MSDVFQVRLSCGHTQTYRAAEDEQLPDGWEEMVSRMEDTGLCEFCERMERMDWYHGRGIRAGVSAALDKARDELIARRQDEHEAKVLAKLDEVIALLRREP